jgi:hypothetical protein
MYNRAEQIRSTGLEKYQVPKVPSPFDCNSETLLLLNVTCRSWSIFMRQTQV